MFLILQKLCLINTVFHKQCDSFIHERFMLFLPWYKTSFFTFLFLSWE